ncbi:Gfo/Idh/MocA family protein [Alicyclobacillus sp. ALC3]|uniref:Gfo/Idh/MocA family protein n=1 Tax=Alicyclobacillus sp. ALC3 TaxID=2796143 RepID=UPI0023794AEE|nr:Gfo/Idh/MocA family oxidoreductase [Alicyclobacillus sp. ALC3]WDL97900.1 Gfo/Idh/MocA family oxidoreductase [Alicyclobacillus sp. ALC3]
MKQRPVRIGMVGYQFMGRAHSHAYRDVGFYFRPQLTPVLQAVCGRSEDAVREAASRLGFAEYETDWRRLVERPDIDVIDIVTPNDTHAQIAQAAAATGKHVLCEKPLATTVDDAGAMHDAVVRAGVSHMVCHNYRFAPAVQFAKRLIDEGRLGRIHHIRAHYLQDWLLNPAAPMTWRMRRDVTGTGALGDIGAHIVDLARFLVGEFKTVTGSLRTIVSQRPLFDESGTGMVDVDDATMFLARFACGAEGVFEATRFAGGNRNANRFEVNGEHGSLRWDLENMNVLEVYFTDDESGLQGFRRINCTERDHPYAGAYWPPGHIIGYEHTFINLVSEFLDAIAKGESPHPNFGDGLRNQQVLAAVERSAASGSWETVET